MEKETFSSNSVAETESVGMTIARRLEEKYPGSLHFVKLRGTLGAGKTALTRGFASVLSPGSRVKSPSYTIVNEYRLGVIPLFHFDLYRLGEDPELDGIGFSEYVESGHCIVEWSEYLGDYEPSDSVTVTIDDLGGDKRKIEITYPDR